jgi:alpha/beta superfamily hydrolase
MAAIATGCGNKGSDSATPAPVPQRGDLIAKPPVKLATYSPAAILVQLSGNPLGETFLSIAYTPKCSIIIYQLIYRTVDAKGNITPASGALMVPSGTDPGCQGNRPMVLYAHGTTTDRGFNIALLGPANAEGILLAAVFAAQGYIVVAPNYVGYDSSTAGYHPYLIADQQSKDMIDALKAARSALPTADAPTSTDSGKLFITGYSEGGYVAMATQSAMQSAGMTVTASAPMSGPYALAAFGDAIFEGQVSEGSVVNLTLLISGYQTAYGNLYANTTDVFEAKYASGIDKLLPSTTALPDLEAQGKLPASAAFNSTPPDPSLATFTPATQPTKLAAVFADGFGTSNLITNAFRLGYLQDAKAAPDGGFPLVTDGLPASNPANKLRLDLKTNDLRNWSPNAPTLLCGGNSDPTVFFFNTQLMQNYWVGHPPAIAPVVLDIDSAITTGDPYGTLKTGFTAAKDLVRANAILQGAHDGGDRAVLDDYHAGLVPAFCLTAVKSFFDAH